MKYGTLSLAILALGLGACQPKVDSQPAHQSPSADHRAASGGKKLATKPVAYIAGRAVREDDLWVGLAEASGGQVLAEAVLDQVLGSRLEAQAKSVTPEMEQREKQILLMELDPDDLDQAVRILDEIEQRRGLGEKRFAGLLWRNAAMRLLVEADVDVSTATLRRAYELEYGPRLQPRLIVKSNLRDATAILNRARAGKSFSDLAAAESTDSSAAQGGLLSPISLADPTYPQSIRDALGELDEGQMSEVIALDNGYAILKLEKKIPARDIQFADVEKELRITVRRRVERLRMEQLARSILSSTKVVVLDPSLGESWRNRQRELKQQ